MDRYGNAFYGGTYGGSLRGLETIRQNYFQGGCGASESSFLKKNEPKASRRLRALE